MGMWLTRSESEATLQCIRLKNMTLPAGLI